MQEETTNQILQSLSADIQLEISDARGRRDGSDVALTRLANALTRNMARREASETLSVSTGPSIETDLGGAAAAQAANKKAN